MGDLHLLVNLMGTASAFGVYQLQLHWSIPAQVAGGDGSPYTAGPGTPTGGQFRLAESMLHLSSFEQLSW